MKELGCLEAEMIYYEFADTYRNKSCEIQFWSVVQLRNISV